MTINKTLDNLERLAKGLVEADSSLDKQLEYFQAANPATILLLTTAIREMEAERDALRASLKELFPSNLCTDNPNVPDTMIMPCDVTMGELRRARLALSTNGGKG